MIVPRLLNSAWMWQGRREARAFHTATERVRAAQSELLLGLVRANADSQFGRRHGFDAIRSVREYQERVPVVSYDQLSPWIEKIAAGEPRVLTVEPVLMFEPTGGSSGGAKLVPYTATLRLQFQRAIACWIHDVMLHAPGVRNGLAYWSISPVCSHHAPPDGLSARYAEHDGNDVRRRRVTAGGIPVGFDSDRDYLGGWQRVLAGRLLVAPPEVSRLRSIENFRYATLAYLLRASSLALISVWSPSFLTALLEGLPTWGDSICRDLADGVLRLPCPREEGRSLRMPWSRNRARARSVGHILSGPGSWAEQLARCWPRLSLLSCWADASAGLYLPALRSWLPDVPIQPKGLLATEGVISFPQIGPRGAGILPVSSDTGWKPLPRGAVLAVRSHFFEFLPCDLHSAGNPAAGECRLADELELGGHYRVVISTGGGLYRYDLGDLVECVGWQGNCPLVRFLGRAGAVTDLVGEKLHEQHVQESLAQVCGRFQLQPELALVTPVRDGRSCYRAFLSLVPQTGPIPPASVLADAIDESLRANPQYDYARNLNQLGPFEVRLLALPRGEAWKRYESQCLASGQKAGDIKPSALDAWPGWLTLFADAEDTSPIS
jgi:hypothetical protein